MTVLSFLFHGLFVLEYADSSYQRDLFAHGSLVLQVCPIKSLVTKSPSARVHVIGVSGRLLLFFGKNAISTLF